MIPNTFICLFYSLSKSLKRKSSNPYSVSLFFFSHEFFLLSFRLVDSNIDAEKEKKKHLQTPIKRSSQSETHKDYANHLQKFLSSSINLFFYNFSSHSTALRVFNLKFNMQTTFTSNLCCVIHDHKLTVRIYDNL